VYRDSKHNSAYAVFDGHGEKGHVVSDNVKKSLPQMLASVVHSQPQDVSSKVQSCYQQVQRNLASKPHLGANSSGTTATVVMHSHESGRLICSHVGDSRAVLLKQTPTCDRLVAEPLTRDHKPELLDERERIEKHGRVVFDGYCHRVVKKHGMVPGLNLSRSLGDTVAHDVCGVTSVPEVMERVMTSQDRPILICSDGIWEVMSPEEAAEIVQEFGPLQAMDAARKLVDKAVERWLAGTKGQMTDDVTVVLAWLQRCPASPSLSFADTCSTQTPSFLGSGSFGRTTTAGSLAGVDADRFGASEQA